MSVRDETYSEYLYLIDELREATVVDLSQITVNEIRPASIVGDFVEFEVRVFHQVYDIHIGSDDPVCLLDVLERTFSNDNEINNLTHNRCPLLIILRFLSVHMLAV